MFRDIAPSPLVVVADVRDAGTLRAIMASERVTRVIHLAAIVGCRAEDDPVTAIDVDASATAALLQLSRQLGLRRVVVMSTKGVLGRLPKRFLHPRYEPVPTEWPHSPTTVYDATKLLVEVLVREARQAGLACAAARLATTWGPGKVAETHAGFALHSELVNRVLEG